MAFVSAVLLFIMIWHCKRFSNLHPHIHTALLVYNHHSMMNVRSMRSSKNYLLFLHSGVSMYTLKEPLEIVRVHARRDTMSQIGNPPSGGTNGAELGAHAFHLALDGVPTAVQHNGVEVALQRNFARDRTVPRIDCPLQTDHVVRCSGGERRRRALGEQNQRHARKLARAQALPHAPRDALDIGQRKQLEIVRGEIPAVGVKHLEKLGRVSARNVVCTADGTCAPAATWPTRKATQASVMSARSAWDASGYLNSHVLDFWRVLLAPPSSM